MDTKADAILNPFTNLDLRKCPFLTCRTYPPAQMQFAPSPLTSPTWWFPLELGRITDSAGTGKKDTNTLEVNHCFVAMNYFLFSKHFALLKGFKN